MSDQPAVLALEDGSVFHGKSFGAAATVEGEAVFNTSMTGYQEILTDPSYYGQIVTMTPPQIGNYGVNEEDVESDGPKARGFVVREISPVVSNWRSGESLDGYLKRHGVPGISGIDTRTLTKRLRVTGAMKSCLSTEGLEPAEAVRRAREWGGLVGVDYVKEVTCREPYLWDESGESSKPFTVEGTHLNRRPPGEARHRVVVMDFGIKRPILRQLRNTGFEVMVVPADTSSKDVLSHKPSGIFLSNGPGDPSAVTYAHQTVRELLDKVPVFGICLGHQIITHALGAGTFKLKFGHRGGNQPVKNLETGVVRITAQNHGFATDPESMKETSAIVTEVNLNDQTVAGLRLRDKPVFAVQYHPEAGPGPNDAGSLFEDFYDAITAEVG